MDQETGRTSALPRGTQAATAAKGHGPDRPTEQAPPGIRSNHHRVGEPTPFLGPLGPPPGEVVGPAGVARHTQPHAAREVAENNPKIPRDGEFSPEESHPIGVFSCDAGWPRPDPMLQVIEVSSTPCHSWGARSFLFRFDENSRSCSRTTRVDKQVFLPAV
jgi:hypothetical protein